MSQHSLSRIFLRTASICPLWPTFGVCSSSQVSSDTTDALISVEIELRNLEFSATGFTFDDQFRLPDLESLTIATTIDCRGVYAILNPTILPSLRAFGLKEHRKAVIQFLCNIPEAFQLLKQLDVFVVLSNALTEEALAILTPLMSHVLVHAGIDSGRNRFFSRHMQHLRLFTEKHHIAMQIREEEDTDLRSIYLDSPTTESYDSQELDSLAAYCQQQNIEVIREAHPTNIYGDTFISPEFWRRQRKLRNTGADQVAKS